MGGNCCRQTLQLAGATDPIETSNVVPVAGAKENAGAGLFGPDMMMLKGSEQAIERDECPITLQSFHTLITSNDLVVTWCCQTCMSQTAITLWIKNFSGSCCPNCRSNAVIPQVLGQQSSVLDGAHSLHILILEGRPSKLIKNLVANVPASLFAEDIHGRTPLHCAIRLQRNDIVQMLCDAGSDIDSIDEDGNTPLFNAATSKNPTALNCLLNSGASAQIKRTYDEIVQSMDSKDCDYQLWSDCLKQISGRNLKKQGICCRPKKEFKLTTVNRA